MMKIILFPECILSPENVIARFLEEAKNPDGLELSIRIKIKTALSIV